MLFENLMYSQIKATAQAHDIQVAIYNYRTEHGAEIDFVVEFPNGDLWTVECKATTSLAKTSHSGFSSFDSTFGPRSRHTIAYLGTVRRRLESGAKLWPWHELIEEMFLKS